MERGKELSTAYCSYTSRVNVGDCEQGLSIIEYVWEERVRRLLWFMPVIHRG